MFTTTHSSSNSYISPDNSFSINLPALEYLSDISAMAAKDIFWLTQCKINFTKERFFLLLY